VVGGFEERAQRLQEQSLVVGGGGLVVVVAAGGRGAGARPRGPRGGQVVAMSAQQRATSSGPGRNTRMSPPLLAFAPGGAPDAEGRSRRCRSNAASAAAVTTSRTGASVYSTSTGKHCPPWMATTTARSRQGGGGGGGSDDAAPAPAA
jgi:hypothetical protein